MSVKVNCSSCGQTRSRSENNFLLCQECERKLAEQSTNRRRERLIVGSGIKEFLSVSEEVAAELEKLDLNQNVTDADIAALAASPRLAYLSSLTLRSCGLGPSSCRLLARSSFIGKLARLDLSGNPLGNEGVQELVASSQLARLSVLTLCDVRCDGVAMSILNSPNLHSLREFDLGDNEMGDDAIRHLVGSPLLSQLTRLSVGRQVTDSGVKALAESAAVGNLADLDFHGNRIDDEGATILATSPFLTRLERLDLGGTRIGNAGGEAFASTTHLPRLKELHFPIPRLELAVMLHLANRYGKGFRGLVLVPDASHQDQTRPARKVREAQLLIAARTAEGRGELSILHETYIPGGTICSTAEMIDNILRNEYGDAVPDSAPQSLEDIVERTPLRDGQDAVPDSTLQSLEVVVYERKQRVYSVSVSGTVEMGRQRSKEETLYSAIQNEGPTRFVIARMEENTVSREHVRVELLGSEQVRVTNISAKVSIQVGDDCQLKAGNSIEVALPVVIALPPRVIRLQKGLPHGDRIKEWAGRLEASSFFDRFTPNFRGHVTDEGSWTRLWRDLRSDEPLPEIDFERELVLVSTTDVGEASSGIEFGINNTDGTLEPRPPKSLFKGDSHTFEYWIKAIPRAGIRHINSKQYEHISAFPEATWDDLVRLYGTPRSGSEFAPVELGQAIVDGRVLVIHNNNSQTISTMAWYAIRNCFDAHVPDPLNIRGHWGSEYYVVFPSPLPAGLEIAFASDAPPEFDPRSSNLEDWRENEQRERQIWEFVERFRRERKPE